MPVRDDRNYRVIEAVAIGPLRERRGWSDEPNAWLIVEFRSWGECFGDRPSGGNGAVPVI
jgi:hypothetical protein